MLLINKILKVLKVLIELNRLIYSYLKDVGTNQTMDDCRYIRDIING